MPENQATAPTAITTAIATGPPRQRHAPATSVATSTTGPNIAVVYPAMASGATPAASRPNRSAVSIPTAIIGVRARASTATTPTSPTATRAGAASGPGARSSSVGKPSSPGRAKG